MTTTSSNFSFDPQMQLSPDQQELLMAALRSNQNGADSFASSSDVSGLPGFGAGIDSLAQSNTNYVAPESLDGDDQSPHQYNRSSSFEVDDSPYQYDFEFDGSYDLDGTEGDSLIGPLPSGKRSSSDLHDKRKSESNADGERKRHEGDDQKQPKKPGRKPLTTEPTTKRKAQNRAAQRAFRERKEKHLKDLETKVDDLEKMSESTNHENSLLRAQVERLQSEIKDYRKRLQLASSSNRSSWGSNPTNTFSFDFPTFGPIPTNSVPRKVSDTATFGVNGNISPVSLPRGSNASQTFDFTSSTSNGAVTGSPNSQRDMQSPPNQHKTPDSVALDDLFTSSIMEGPYATPPVDFSSINSTKSSSGSRVNSVNSVISGHRGNSMSSADFSASPSASSQSQGGPSSSCGTSPEPTALSPPSSKLESTLNTINEEHADDNSRHTPSDAPAKTALTNAALNAFSASDNGQQNDWLAPQSGFSVDPNLFGDYRDPSLDIFNANYDTFLNNEAFMLPEFGANPFNSDILQETITALPTTEKFEKEAPKKTGNKQSIPRGSLNCNKIWDKVSAMTETEDLDIDGLCSELRAKAKCTENGLVVADSDFHSTVEQFRRKQA